MEGSKYARAAAASRPGVYLPPGDPGRRADQHATRSAGDSTKCEASGRDPGRAAASGGRASGMGRLGWKEWGVLRNKGTEWSRRRTGSGLGRWGGR